MSDAAEKTSTVGLIGALALLIGVPLSCEYRIRNERDEAEAICRRTIERNYAVPAERAQKDIEAQRAWEGR